MKKPNSLDEHNNFLDYVYDRDVNFKDTADDLYSHINNLNYKRELLFSIRGYIKSSYELQSPHYIYIISLRLFRSVLFDL